MADDGLGAVAAVAVHNGTWIITSAVEGRLFSFAAMRCTHSISLLVAAQVAHAPMFMHLDVYGDRACLGYQIKAASCAGVTMCHR